MYIVLQVITAKCFSCHQAPEKYIAPLAELYIKLWQLWQLPVITDDAIPVKQYIQMRQLEQRVDMTNKTLLWQLWQLAVITSDTIFIQLWQLQQLAVIHVTKYWYIYNNFHSWLFLPVTQNIYNSDSWNSGCCYRKHYIYTAVTARDQTNLIGLLARKLQNKDAPKTVTLEKIHIATQVQNTSLKDYLEFPATKSWFLLPIYGSCSHILDGSGLKIGRRLLALLGC